MGLSCSCCARPQLLMLATCAAAYLHGVSIRAGHNGCLQCMAAVQRRKPECPLCRATFPAGLLLTVNGGLRDLIALASTLHTVEEPDGWQTLAAVKVIIISLNQIGSHSIFPMTKDPRIMHARALL